MEKKKIKSYTVITRTKDGKLKELCKYNSNGNITYRNDANNYEASWEYDENYNMTHHTDSDGVKEVYKFNPDGNRVYGKTNCTRSVYEYRDGKLIHGKTTTAIYGGVDTYEYFWEYNEQGKPTKFHDSTGFEEIWRYDESGNTIYHKSSHRNQIDIEEFWEYTVDENGGKTKHYTNSKGFDEVTVFNSAGYEIYFKDSSGHEESWKYNDNNNITRHLISSKTGEAVEETWEYNEKGLPIQHNENYDTVEIWEYDENYNVIRHKTKISDEHCKYNEDHKIIYRRNSLGFEEFWKYNENGDVETYTDFTGDVSEYEYIYE